MDFIMDNFIWAIIIVIVVLMAIVGYIADKTDFGRKEFEKRVVEDKPKKEKVKKEKVKKDKKKKEEVVEEIPAVSEISNEVSLETNVDVVDNTVSEQEFMPVSEENEMGNIDNFAVNTDVDFNNEVNESNEESTIDQSLFEPLPSIDQVFSQVPSQEVEANVNAETTESSVESDDDIWKF